MDDVVEAEDGREDTDIPTGMPDSVHHESIDLEPDLVWDTPNGLVDAWYTQDGGENLLMEIAILVANGKPSHAVDLNDNAIRIHLRDTVFQLPQGFPTEKQLVQSMYADMIFTVDGQGVEYSYVLQDKDNFISDWENDRPSAYYRYDSSGSKTLSQFTISEVAALLVYQSMQQLTTDEQLNYTLYTASTHDDDDGL